MTLRAPFIVSFIAVLFVVLLMLLSFPALFAAPPDHPLAQEPTKAPYVFPTPIYIPTYPGEAVEPPAPKATATREVPVSSKDRTYTVESGDNPWTIAQKVYGSGAKYPAILAANGLTEKSVLKIGTVLRIPANDASGQALPTAEPTSAATRPPAPSPAATAPVIQPTAPALTSISTPIPATSASGAFPTVIYDIAGLTINLFSLFFLVGSVSTAALAVLVYKRSNRDERMSLMVRRIRTK